MACAQELKALIQQQDYPGVGEYCKHAPVATAARLSPLHAACVSDMLCPAIQAAAGDNSAEVQVVQLLKWLRGCMAHMLPENNLPQVSLVREIIMKSQTCDFVLFCPRKLPLLVHLRHACVKVSTPAIS